MSKTQDGHVHASTEKSVETCHLPVQAGTQIIILTVWLTL